MPDTADKNTQATGEERESTAWRLVNLVFVLNASRAPIPTDQIVGDPDLGYGSGNRESDKHKFRRDREKLLDYGIVISEVRGAGAEATDESAWAIDTERTYLTPGLILEEDAERLLAAIDALLLRPCLPYRRTLERLRSKVAGLCSVGTGAPNSERLTVGPDSIAEAAWAALSLRRKLTFLYVDGRGRQTKRTVEPYGMFSLDGADYLVGADDTRHQVRTFRLDRIERTWRPKGSYTIPDTFDINDYLFLPFDLSEGKGEPAVFSFPGQRTQAEIDAVTHRRGALEQAGDSSWRWTVEVRDLQAAARWALGHAGMGMRPVDPPSLRHAWNEQIDKAVSAHV